MKTKHVLYKALAKLRCVPGLLWRAMFSAALGLTMFCTVVPWAQAQRAQPTVGGEYILTLLVVVLPLVIFRR